MTLVQQSSTLERIVSHSPVFIWEIPLGTLSVSLFIFVFLYMSRWRLERNDAFGLVMHEIFGGWAPADHLGDVLTLL